MSHDGLDKKEEDYYEIIMKIKENKDNDWSYKTSTKFF
jgi:hypothetical protein